MPHFARSALEVSGHTPSSDTLLIGELAPEGSETTKAESPIPPLGFLRALYCVGPSYKPVQEARAEPRSCAPRPSPGGAIAP